MKLRRSGPLVLCLFAVVAAAQNIANVKFVAEPTVVLRPGSLAHLKPGDALRANDVVVIGPEGRARIVLLDASELTVGPGTEMRIITHDPEKQQTLIEMLHGRLRAKVTPVKKQGGYFKIVTPTAVAYALGSEIVAETINPVVPFNEPAMTELVLKHADARVQQANNVIPVANPPAAADNLQRVPPAQNPPRQAEVPTEEVFRTTVDVARKKVREDYRKKAQELTGSRTVNGIAYDTDTISRMVATRDMYVQQLQQFVYRLNTLDDLRKDQRIALLQKIIPKVKEAKYWADLIDHRRGPQADSLLVTGYHTYLQEKAAQAEANGDTATANIIRRAEQLPLGPAQQLLYDQFSAAIDSDPLVGLLYNQISGDVTDSVGANLVSLDLAVDKAKQQAKEEIQRANQITTVEGMTEFLKPQYARARFFAGNAFGGLKEVNNLDEFAHLYSENAAAEAEVAKIKLAIIVSGTAVVAIVAAPVAGLVATQLGAGTAGVATTTAITSAVGSGLNLGAMGVQLVWDGKELVAVSSELSHAEKGQVVLGKEGREAVQALQTQQKSAAGQVGLDVIFATISARDFKISLDRAKAAAAASAGNTGAAGASAAGGTSTAISSLSPDLQAIANQFGLDVAMGVRAGRLLKIPEAQIQKALDLAHIPDNLNQPLPVLEKINPMGVQRVKAALRSREALAGLQNIDQQIAAAQKAGLSQEQIASAVTAAQRTGTVEGWGVLFARQLKETEVLNAIRAQGGKVLIDPAELADMTKQEVLPFQQARTAGSLLETKFVKRLLDVRAKVTLLAKGNIGIQLTEDELVLLKEHILPGGDNILKWFGYDLETREFFQVFDEQFIQDLRSALTRAADSGNSAARAALAELDFATAGTSYAAGAATAAAKRGEQAVTVDLLQLKLEQVTQLTNGQLRKIPPAVFESYPPDLQAAIRQEITRRDMLPRAGISAESGVVQVNPQTAAQRYAELSQRLSNEDLNKLAAKLSSDPNADPALKTAINNEIARRTTPTPAAAAKQEGSAAIPTQPGNSVGSGAAAAANAVNAGGQGSQGDDTNPAGFVPVSGRPQGACKEAEEKCAKWEEQYDEADSEVSKAQDDLDNAITAAQHSAAALNAAAMAVDKATTPGERASAQQILDAKTQEDQAAVKAQTDAEAALRKAVDKREKAREGWAKCLDEARALCEKKMAQNTVPEQSGNAKQETPQQQPEPQSSAVPAPGASTGSSTSSSGSNTSGTSGTSGTSSNSGASSSSNATGTSGQAVPNAPVPETPVSAKMPECKNSLDDCQALGLAAAQKEREALLAQDEANHVTQMLSDADALMHASFTDHDNAAALFHAASGYEDLATMARMRAKKYPADQAAASEEAADYSAQASQARAKANEAQAKGDSEQQQAQQLREKANSAKARAEALAKEAEEAWSLYHQCMDLPICPQKTMQAQNPETQGELTPAGAGNATPPSSFKDCPQALDWLERAKSLHKQAAELMARAAAARASGDMNAATSAELDGHSFETMAREREREAAYALRDCPHKTVATNEGAGQPNAPQAPAPVPQSTQSLYQIPAGQLGQATQNLSTPVAGTQVTVLEHFGGVVAQGAAVYLNALETSYIPAGGRPGQPELAFKNGQESPGLKQVSIQNGSETGTQGDSTHLVQSLARDNFNANGTPCVGETIVNGVSSSPNSQVQWTITGTGTSTPLAQAHITNSGPCPAQFVVTNGAVVVPAHVIGKAAGILGGIALGAATGVAAIPNLKEFQDATTGGEVVTVPGVGPGPLTEVALGGGSSKEAEGGPNTVTVPIRSFCLDLHKLAPHPRTAYKFADVDKQKQLGSYGGIVNQVFRQVQSGAVQMPPGHSLDSFGQWTLWAKRENLDAKKFAEEYVNLVSKNYKAQNKKFDGAAKAQTEETAGQLYSAVQRVLSTMPK